MTRIRLITENVKSEILEGIHTASTIYILTSFVMKSGVELLRPYLIAAAKRGADIKICTGDYLFVTQPDALKKLLFADFKNVEVRMWRSNGTSFHPKAYLFNHMEKGTFIVGSSNLSRSALTTGVEWNLVMEKEAEPDTFEDAVDRFLKVFYDDQTVPVNEETVKKYANQYEEYHRKNPNLATTWAKQEEIELMLPNEEKEKTTTEEVTNESPSHYRTKIEPRSSQQRALEALEATIAEDYDKAMVVMATGLGKTYLAAFFARRFRRVLFIAHREEILYQAQQSFQQVMPDRNYGIYNGKMKDTATDNIFASIFTLSMKEHLQIFPQDYFDLIVVDEFHHAAAQSYKRILDHFTPEFLLGITATPDRMDGKDVYAICDGNVAFQMHFIEAIQQGWLTPFHYFGVYDDTDYSQITWLGTKYDQSELLAAQLREGLAKNILEAWVKHKQTRTIGFCSSIKQATLLSNFFNENGYDTISLHSQSVINRKEAIQKLERGEHDVIFTVDLFNEGVDIPLVDTLLFVRPTESLTVFTQQIGRGLRLHGGKNHCTIIDLIGNYRNADIKLSLFDTERNEKGTKKQKTVPIVPTQCEISLDVEVIDLLKELTKKKQPRKEKLLQAYLDLKEEIGKRPTYLDMHLHGNINTREIKQEFKSYVGFLYWAEELISKEQEVFQDYKAWVEEVEKTAMSKSYKMVLLSYMLNRGESNWHNAITPEEVAPYFYRYFTEKEHRKQADFSDKKTRKLWNYDQEKVAKIVANMPMTKWSGSSKGLLVFDGDKFRLGFDVTEKDLGTLFQMTREVCDYRLHDYFERKGR
ncbi:DEAD/DEAH box helicase family protein [Aquibacillus sp. 3ASR75-11]|uniref:DEAD/DEAH box helicase family protein n=1 Tax=Terrihalobacillus insolitus TaxID=2950438 RepID=A0A9X3WS69_9BACI|nr:DEAD/DEAH box helicase family protein [Terrihalobacillus insolitus]MDC3413120.1 DEAD/DEAH box helicase family protein [Terrihalobacillus insolitus]MDC3424862.1 DEAD/DEAH box helicase family protein [Terrihalobacillus insolitus]